MTRSKPAPHRPSRLAKHRRRCRAQGLTRVEVAVLREDAAVIREIARRLTSSGAEALELRARYRPSAAEIKTGADLLNFLQASPLGEVELDLARDRSLGRDIELP